MGTSAETQSPTYKDMKSIKQKLWKWNARNCSCRYCNPTWRQWLFGVK